MTIPGQMQTVFRRQANFAFLRGRLFAARLELAVASGLILMTWALARDPRLVLVPALLLLGFTVTLSFFGRAVGRSVLPGLLLGLVPLGCALSAQSIGHVCFAGACSSICVPLCSAGGVLAGVLLARAARAMPSPLSVWLSGGSIILCAGAMGCVCVGAGGLVGMGLGFLASAGVLAWPKSLHSSS